MPESNQNQLSLELGDISNKLLLEAHRSQVQALELLKQSIAASELGSQYSINRNMHCYQSVREALNQEFAQLIEATETTLKRYETGMIGRGLNALKSENQN